MQSLILGLRCSLMHLATSMARHSTCIATKDHLHGDDDSAGMCAIAALVQPSYRYLIERAVGDYCHYEDVKDAR